VNKLHPGAGSARGITSKSTNPQGGTTKSRGSLTDCISKGGTGPLDLFLGKKGIKGGGLKVEIKVGTGTFSYCPFSIDCNVEFARRSGYKVRSPGCASSRCLTLLARDEMVHYYYSHGQKYDERHMRTVIKKGYWRRSSGKTREGVFLAGRAGSIEGRQSKRSKKGRGEASVEKCSLGDGAKNARDPMWVCRESEGLERTGKLKKKWTGHGIMGKLGRDPLVTQGCYENK